MHSLDKNWMPPFFRHPAIPPHPAEAEGEDSRKYVELFYIANIIVSNQADMVLNSTQPT